MKRRLAVVRATVPSLAWSETVLVCANVGGEHQVTYEPDASNLVLSSPGRSTLYPVLVDDNQDASHVVTAHTVGDGPTARLHLRPYLKMEFWLDGQLTQTDGCYATSQ